jgi:RNA polymerase sigma-70 factor (TIGR02943 family)
MNKIKYSGDAASTVKYWVGLYSDNMYSWAFHKTGSRELAEDLVQDTFLAACQAFSKFEGKSEPKTWLFAILNNKIAGHFRKQYRMHTAAGNDHGSSLLNRVFDSSNAWRSEELPKEWLQQEGDLVDDAAFVAILQKCMDKLPAQWMAAIQLKYLEEKKGRQICQELEINPSNFWQVLHRARLQLRKCLENHWFKLQ